MATALGSTSATLPQYSVLLVDDERDVRDQLRLRFEMEGFRVFDADGGDAALMLCRSVRPDLVVTDIRMSKGTGTELLKRLHNEEPAPMPIVMCISGYSDLKSHDAYDFGACAIFKKPFDMRELLAAARRFLELREAEAKASLMLNRFERDLRALVETTLKVDRGSTNLEAPIEDLREITAMILHEINRPLSVISMNSSLLVGALQETPPRLPAAVKMATNVESSCKKLVQISRGMRELFLKNRGGNDAMHLAADLVRSAVSHLNESGKLRAVDLEIEIQDRPCFVQGSSAQLSQALVNLVENAAQASEGGSLHLVRILVKEDASSVTFTVEDSGPGVPHELRDKIFESFFSTKGANGTGMGLAVAAKIAEAHGGSLVLAQSQAGARFELTLPRVRPA